jgi:hypothetical protein
VTTQWISQKQFRASTWTVALLGRTFGQMSLPMEQKACLSLSAWLHGLLYIGSSQEAGGREHGLCKK